MNKLPDTYWLSRNGWLTIDANEYKRHQGDGYGLRLLTREKKKRGRYRTRLVRWAKDLPQLVGDAEKYLRKRVEHIRVLGVHNNTDEPVTLFGTVIEPDEWGRFQPSELK